MKCFGFKKNRGIDMKRLKLAAVIAAVILFSCAGCSFGEKPTEDVNEPPKDAVTSSQNVNRKPKTPEEYLERFRDSGIAGFVKTDGTKLIDGDGNEYLIKGIGFTNDAIYSVDYPAENHHDEDSYKEIADLGFNTVRFYLNYRFFEKDDYPYSYSVSAFHWLDENITWAGENGIRLILDMHCPQGTYDSPGESSVNLWLDEENQNRLIALWSEISKRYKDEPTVLGYSFVNEPYLPLVDDSVEKSADMWESLAKRLTEAVRENDKNHILFFESCGAILDTATGIENWSPFNGQLHFFDVDDDNYAYEFHMYVPFDFTHQNVGMNSGKYQEYPEDGRKSIEGALTPFIEFGKEKNVPIFLGEFGASLWAFNEDRGGEKWAADMLDVCLENGLNFSYHCYHEDCFGLYRNAAWQERDFYNDKLGDVFKEKLSK